jgi:hypothetical protein
MRLRRASTAIWLGIGTGTGTTTGGSTGNGGAGGASVTGGGIVTALPEGGFDARDPTDAPPCSVIQVANEVKVVTTHSPVDL